MNAHEQGFTLEIEGLDTFAQFVAIIRGEPDVAKIREMTARLTASTTALRKAEDADAATRPPAA